MMTSNTTYRIRKYIQHLFTARHTRGDGIHSPYLYYLVEKIIRDTNAYYCFSTIENLRNQLLKDHRTVNTTDFGTGTSGTKTVQQIAHNELESPRVGQLLMRICIYVGQQLERPLNIIELGTSLGISTAYLASASSTNRITTYEGSPEIAALAEQNWETLGLKNITLIQGNIHETLAPKEPIDIAYMDANHSYEATMLYYNIIRTHAHEKSIIILDDIYHNPGMTQAWTEICARPEVTSTMNLYHIGILFFDPHFHKKHYKLHL